MTTPKTTDSTRSAGISSSPCIRNCCLDEQDICMGCYRTLKEILAWHKATDDERIIILKLCHARQEKDLNR
ncbi:DUF1289 domain-containing protein [uncultured Amphritea sp.]|uniref:DUF1289 domain-containing protein n=1 Tax=uncultured Amphritea sp. TaxID=981605 RepID=UPI0026202EB6|nr:DUF1289 domain-containing protein [uncultured Amphritea sp.]